MGWRPHLSSPAPIRSMKRPLMTRRDDSLIGQIVAANVVLVAHHAVRRQPRRRPRPDRRRPALVVPDPRARDHPHPVREPLDAPAPLRPARAADPRIEGIDPAEPSSHQLPDQDPVEEIDKLSRSFNGLLERIEEERRRSGTLAMRAQEEERRRLARDLHDEVNQALTAILLRLEALAQDSPAVEHRGGQRAQAAREPGDGGAPEPRPPAAPDRARRPRPDAGSRDAAQALLGAHRGRGEPQRRRRRPTRSPRTCRRRSTGSSRRRSPTSAATPAPPPSRWTSRPATSGSSCTCATTAPASTRPR